MLSLHTENRGCILHKLRQLIRVLDKEKGEKREIKWRRKKRKRKRKGKRKGKRKRKKRKEKRMREKPDPGLTGITVKLLSQNHE